MEELLMEPRVWLPREPDRGAVLLSGNRKGEHPFQKVCTIMLLVLFLSVGILLGRNCSNTLMQLLNPPYRIIWQCPVPSVPEKAGVYSVKPLDMDQSMGVGTDIGERVGAEYTMVSYGKDSTYFMDSTASGGVHFLIVSNTTGSYQYWTHKEAGVSWVNADRRTVEHALEAFGVKVPSAAEFSSEGNGWHRFSVNGLIRDGQMLDGTIRCRYAQDGTIKVLENDLIAYSLSHCEELLSGEEIRQRLLREHASRQLASGNGGTAVITNAKLQYRQEEIHGMKLYYVLTILPEGGTRSREILLPAARE